LSMAILLAFTSCAPRYIAPQPEFAWPEMALSKIGDSLGIYIPYDNLNLICKPDLSQPCCIHKDIHIGDGASQAVLSASQAVFAYALMLGEQPTDTYIKSLNLRGLLHLKDITANFEFLPHIEDRFDNDKEIREPDKYDILITLNLNFSAIDFALDDISEFNISVLTESEKPAAKRKINSQLKKLSKTALEQAAGYLARKLVNFYGARS